jgi:importin subunit alpha-1
MHKLDIETFTSNIANKMKFQLKDFNILCQLIYSED